MDYRQIIDIYYPRGSRRRDIYLDHCGKVASLALGILKNKELELDAGLVEEAAMLHDIGICLTDAPSLDCHGTSHYLLHGILGGRMLRDHGYCEEVARVAERHTGTGLSPREAGEIILPKLSFPVPLPPLMPQTRLERLVCYADKFYSKSGPSSRKSMERARTSVAKFGPENAARFDALVSEFGEV